MTAARERRGLPQRERSRYSARMLPRERVEAALSFRAPDRVPLEIHPSPAGLYEHGQKLLDLMRSCEHDFGDSAGFAMPELPGPADFDADGRYHAIRTDAWGTTWEHRIFGIWGHPVEWPLNDLARLPTWQAPPSPPLAGPSFDEARARCARHRARSWYVGDAGALFETLRWLRRFESVLIDIEDDTPEINRIADLVNGYNLGLVRHGLAIGADSFRFGDDLGSANALMISPASFRRFFKPRYAELFALARSTGSRLFMHSCGQIMEVLDDLRELGVCAIWPQLPLYDLPELAARCRSLGMAVQLHPDRGELMQRGTPAQVRDYVLRLLDTFRAGDGGAWLYIEIDPGFPWENVRVLFSTVNEARGMSRL
jgi:uroporphyrinogen decarboxylase